MTDIGELNSFLGIRIKQTSRGLFLSQRAYREQLLARFQMMDCNSSKSPTEVNPAKHEDVNGETIIKLIPYRELVGCLMFLMLNTRPDISVAVNYYSRFQSNAKMAHWKGLKRILRYIKGTLDYGLIFRRGTNPGIPLQVYVDANWATDDDRKSTTGFLLQVFGSTVSWSTRKQTGITLSSTEAEYVALATALMDAIWLKGLLEDFNPLATAGFETYRPYHPVGIQLRRTPRTAKF
ncbi:secreted RxLR effector protein 161-like [Osmia bicornis bicornis]|uniref:secreted RxLR effector protein 161-like n=1 Tax=Osmia bicornis bicornis TaxID=1437191 RepID=UPI001EAED0C4|nr:secreted RxLR effector protein 161-like [Osmia bicornis bicornis]